MILSSNLFFKSGLFLLFKNLHYYLKKEFMEISIDKNSLTKKEVDTDNLIAKIASGKAILFTGAGFSSLTKDLDSKEPSTSRELARCICELGNFPTELYDDDLRFVTDYFLTNNSSDKLIDFLKRKYTIKDTDEVHNIICSLNWKRFYTTNYDKSIEIASKNVGKKVESIDISFATENYYKRESLCIHLNGSIDSLNEESLGNNFKLSTSSYISPDSFIQSDWNYYFKKDLERCSAIIFVGYSMYDIEIQKILYENESLKEKTYFITSPNPNPKTTFTLSKFGNVLDIGLVGFAKLIEMNKSVLDDYDTEYHLQSFTQYELPEKNIKIDDDDIEALIMYGKVDTASIADSVLGEQRVPYIIIRQHLDMIKRFIDMDKNIIIYSDMGNGKSIILEQIQAYLTAYSFDCYFITDYEGDFIDDIDYLNKQKNRNIILIIDGYSKYIELIKHYSYSLPDNIKIIATSRTGDHERLRSNLKDFNFKYNEMSIDFLHDSEIESFIDIIDNLGVWREKAGYGDTSKSRYIKSKNNAQISLSLLDLFDSPQIKDRISSEISPLLKDDLMKDTIFAIALAQIVGVICTNSIISNIAGNDEIYNSEATRTRNFKNLFVTNGQGIEPKSSIFCLSLIRNHFTSTYIVRTLLKIAQNLNGYNSKDYAQREVFISILKFSFVERLLSEHNKKGSLKSYYENLKISVSWLKYNPQFWLQYAMSHITFKEYPKAQQFLDQSYSLASSKSDSYTTSYIDSQQARLHVLVAMDELDQNKSFTIFSKAHSLLDGLDNNVYKFRQVSMYRDYYDNYYAKLSNGNKVSFQRYCQKLVKSIISSVDRNEIDLVQQKPIKKAKDELEFILESIGS